MTPASGSKLGYAARLGACVGLFALGSSAQEADVAARFWNQPRGNAESTAVLPLEPVRNDPREAWRFEQDELLAEPVSWGDLVFVAGRKGRERSLTAIEIESGKELAATKIGGTGAVRLLAWTGMLALIDAEGLETYTFRQGSLKLKKRLKGSFPGEAALAQGLVFLADGKSLTVVELETLRILGSREAGGGRPAIVSDDNGGLFVATYGSGVKTNYEGQWLKLYVTGVKGVATKDLELRSERIITRTELNDRQVRDMPGFVALLEKVSRAQVKWYTDSRRAIRGSGDETYYCDVTDGQEGRTVPILTPAAIWKGVAVGFDDEGNLIRFSFDGKKETVVAKSSLPAGAHPGPATGASDVIYPGNWAVEAQIGRVLWVMKGLDAATPLLPIADGRVLCGTKKGVVVCLADPRRAGAVASPGAPTGPAASSGPGRPDRMPGVILADGTVLLGKVAWLPRGGVAVETADGRKQFEQREFAFAETVDKDRRRGDEYPVVAAWRGVLDAEVATMLEGLVRSAADDRFVQAGAALLQEARGYGLPADRARALEDLLAGKQENRDANAAAKLKKRAGEERLARAAVTEEFRRAASWCVERGLAGAATSLLAASQKVQREEATVTMVQSLVPAGFPWKANADATTRWMSWSAECLPAGAEFVPKTDPAWKGKTGVWQERALALRTRNVVLFTLEQDPHVIGACLNRGEGTLRALEELLNLPVAPSDAERMEVQLYDTRGAFDAAAQGKTLESSSGFFSPEERVSRFCVPGGAEAETGTAALHRAVAHELVHQFLVQRWLGGKPASSAREPGFWVVEGIARFLEDQPLELGRARRGLDDPSAPSIDRTCRVSEQGALMPLARLVLLDQDDFIDLEKNAILEIQPRASQAPVLLSEQELFRDQAGTLVFYLMNHSPTARQALIDYLLAYYKGELDGNGWKRLSWDSLVRLESDFQAFVQGLG